MRTVRVKSLIEKDYRISEAYKTLRTNLLFCGDDVKVIVVTSCDENEGKTTVTLELAKSLAEVGKRVLVIDADLRKSVVRERYMDDDVPVDGLSEFLSGQAELADILNGTTDERLFIITAGRYPTNPVELLSTKKFKTLLENSRLSFDYVLIDTPPLGLVIDSAVVAEDCDGALLIMNAGRNRARFIQTVLDQLEKSNCRLLGTVFNNVQVGRNFYYKHYYNHYYRGYYYRHRYYSNSDPNLPENQTKPETDFADFIDAK